MLPNSEQHWKLGLLYPMEHWGQVPQIWLVTAFSLLWHLKGNIGRHSNRLSTHARTRTQTHRLSRGRHNIQYNILHHSLFLSLCELLCFHGLPMSPIHSLFEFPNAKWYWTVVSVGQRSVCAFNPHLWTQKSPLWSLGSTEDNLSTFMVLSTRYNPPAVLKMVWFY